MLDSDIEIFRKLSVNEQDIITRVLSECLQGTYESENLYDKLSEEGINFLVMELNKLK